MEAVGTFGLRVAGALALAMAGACVANAMPGNEEFDKALTLEADPENGARLYRNCVACHGAEGWGDPSGSYPQIAGQLSSVIIKQLADIRAGNRDNPIMRAFSSQRALGDAQSIADVAAYISQMPMTPDNGRAIGGGLAYGKEVYDRECADCHGSNGQGDQAEHIPAIYGQHYHYLVRQFHWIRNGRRRNADPEMVEQIERFTARDISAVMAYTSSLRPPPEKLAKRGWQNPDFPKQWRGWRPSANPR